MLAGRRLSSTARAASFRSHPSPLAPRRSRARLCAAEACWPTTTRLAVGREAYIRGAATATAAVSSSQRSVGGAQVAMASLSAGKRHKVTVVGSGNWGCTIAKVVAENCTARPDLFEPEVQMWVYEETVTISEKSKFYEQGEHKLSELINRIHCNVKYLDNILLPKNLIANPDLEDSVKDSTILVFNMPHQFIPRIAGRLQGKIVPYARGISCIKGIEVSEKGVRLFSEMIGDELGIYCGALSGANIATEVALEKWCETTVAYDPPQVDSRAASPVATPGHSPRVSGVFADLTMTAADGLMPKAFKKPKGLTPLPAEYPSLSHENMRALFHRPYFHVRVVDDVVSVSLGGALKNVVALGAGMVAGLGWGDNAKSAIMRIGLLEEVKFAAQFFSDKPGSRVNKETFTQESCGVADIITSSMGGRNYRCAKMAVEDMLQGGEIFDIKAVEERELNGQVLQGTDTAIEVNRFLAARKAELDFPLFTAVFQVLDNKLHPRDIPAFLDPTKSH